MADDDRRVYENGNANFDRAETMELPDILRRLRERSPRVAAAGSDFSDLRVLFSDGASIPQPNPGD